MYPEHNMKINNSNYNKRQFWSYKRLKSLTNKNKTHKNKTHKSFHIINNKVVINKKLISRLDSIYIPPAYKDLVVAKSESNKIQIIGTDNKGRRQYIYNPNAYNPGNPTALPPVPATGSRNFELHESEQTRLIIKILMEILSWK